MERLLHQITNIIGKESHVTRCLAGSNATFVYILRTGTKQSARS